MEEEVTIINKDYRTACCMGTNKRDERVVSGKECKSERVRERSRSERLLTRSQQNAVRPLTAPILENTRNDRYALLPDDNPDHKG